MSAPGNVSRREFLWALASLGASAGSAGLLAACGLAAPGAASKRPPRVGYLSIGPAASASSGSVAAFKQGLRELGYTEGQNLLIDYRFAENEQQSLPKLAAELVALKVDIIAAVSVPAATAAKTASATVPIVLLPPGDPVAAGLAASPAHPGGSVTGLNNMAMALNSKRLELLRQAVPGISSVGYFWNPGIQGMSADSMQAQADGQRLGLHMEALPASTAAEFDMALKTAATRQLDGLMVFPDPFISLQVAAIVDLAASKRLPGMYPARNWADAGGLMAYGENFDELFRRAASYVDRILKGAKPADLPVEGPTKFDFVVNLRTAGAIGLSVPPALLSQATQVIQ